MTARHRDIYKIRHFTHFSLSAKLQAIFMQKPWGRLQVDPPFQRDAGLWSYCLCSKIASVFLATFVGNVSEWRMMDEHVHTELPGKN